MNVSVITLSLTVSDTIDLLIAYLTLTLTSYAISGNTHSHRP